jgi:D-alanyl-D-alanine carboxypeptidase
MSTWLPGLVPGGRRITVRNLLQHTTGLYDYLEDRNYVTRAYQTPNRIWAPEELVKYAVQFPPAFTPGTQGQWDYSSTNFVILGMIVEKVTGNLLAAEIRSRILEPLQLNATFFTPQDSVVGPQAHGYSRSVDQTRVAMSMVYATASIVSTIGDVRAFAEGLFGGKLLKPETMALMQGFVNGKGQYNMPRLEYGFGLMRNQLPAGPGPNGKARPAEVVTVLGHIGGFGGFRSALWYAPESGIIVAIGMNQAATDPNILATRLFDAALAGTGR